MWEVCKLPNCCYAKPLRDIHITRANQDGRKGGTFFFRPLLPDNMALYSTNPTPTLSVHPRFHQSILNGNRSERVRAERGRRGWGIRKSPILGCLLLQGSSAPVLFAWTLVKPWSRSVLSWQSVNGPDCSLLSGEVVQSAAGQTVLYSYSRDPHRPASHPKHFDKV
jgi:hypothetical protein